MTHPPQTFTIDATPRGSAGSQMMGIFGIGLIVAAFPLILVSANLAATVLLLGAAAWHLPRKRPDISLTVRWGVLL